MTTLSLTAVKLLLLMALSPMGSPVCDSVKERSSGAAPPRDASAPTLNTTAAEIYYFHTDHLGSSAWVTDTLGHAVQHLAYLPWGESWVSQKTGNFSTIYTFSGKERDEETGYSYFGQRFYDSQLSFWLSADPMRGKYPNMSPFVYCANNPIKLVDPNGEDVKIVKDSEKKQVIISANFYYNNKDLGREAEVFINGFNKALNSWSDDIREALKDESLGVSDYAVIFNFNCLESDNPKQSALSDKDHIGNWLSGQFDISSIEAEVSNCNFFKANVDKYSKGESNKNVLFYGTEDINQGTIKHEIGHFFGLYDRDRQNHKERYIKNDLMSYDKPTRGNAVEPFKRVWRSAGLDKPGNQSVIINKNNRELLE